MKEANPNGLDIDLLQTAFPGHITVEVEGKGKIIVEPSYETLAEGLADAIAFHAQGKVISLVTKEIVTNTTVTAIDTDARIITIRYNYPQ